MPRGRFVKRPYGSIQIRTISLAAGGFESMQKLIIGILFIVLGIGIILTSVLAKEILKTRIKNDAISYRLLFTGIGLLAIGVFAIVFS